MSFKQGPECCGGSVLQVRGDDNEPIHLALSAQQFFITFCYNKAKWAKYGRFKVLTSARELRFASTLYYIEQYFDRKKNKPQAVV